MQDEIEPTEQDSTAPPKPKPPYKLLGAALAFCGILIVIGQWSASDSKDDKRKPERSFVLAGHRAHTDAPALACPKANVPGRFVELMQTDRTAAIRYASGADCFMLEANTQGSVEDNSAWSNASCFRPEGQTECQWVFMKSLQDSDEAQ